MDRLNRPGRWRLSKPPAKGAAERFCSDWFHFMFSGDLPIAYWRQGSPAGSKVGNQIK